MRYLLKTEGVEFEVAKAPVPKMEQNGVQRVNKMTGLPVWTVGLLVLDTAAETAEDLMVSVASATMPAVRWREPVEVTGLEVVPWQSRDKKTGEDRSGVVFRVSEIRPIGFGATAAA